MPDARKVVEAKGGAEGLTRVSHDAQMVFLVGAPGSGKSALGRRVCAELGLRFVDLPLVTAARMQPSRNSCEPEAPMW